MSCNDIDEHYRVAWAGYPDDSRSRVPVPIPGEGIPFWNVL